MMLVVVLASVAVLAQSAWAHTCIHDALHARRAARGETAEHWTAHKKRAVAQSGGSRVRLPDTYEPIRIKLDYTFLSPNADPNGLCLEVGQWARIGSPPDETAEAHQPVCSESCDSLRAGMAADVNATVGCDCWYRCAKEDLFYKQKRAELVERLFPRAVERLERSLAVRRTPLSIGSRTRCGCSGAQVPISDELRAQYTNYTEHDLVLFVTAHSTRMLSGDTLAYACSCENDILGRPVFGHINWGANKIDFRDGERIDLQVGVAVHEMTHALGFAHQKYDQFLDVDKVDFGSTVDAGEFEYPMRARSDFVKNQMFETTNADGDKVRKEVSFLASEHVREAVREHFDCDELIGAELEDQGSSGTAGSHWEKRLFNNEYMTGSSSYDPIYSKMTLALLEDSGWYKANFSHATEFLFGQREGCDFARPRCDAWAGPYRCTPAQQGHWGCTFDRNARGICSISKYNGELEPWNRYFKGQPDVGGGRLADFCPFFSYSSNLQSDCRNPNFQEDNLFVRGEHFSESARCLDSTLLIKSKTGLKGSGGCFSLRCIDGKLYARIADEYRDCSTPNAEIKVDGYNGHVKCPPRALADQLCAEVPQVKELPTLKSIDPDTGSEPKVGQRFDFTGTGLRTAISARIGKQLCGKLIGQPTDTTMSCEIVESDIGDSVELPPPDNDGNLVEGFKNIFVEDSSNVLYYDAVVELESGLTAFLGEAYEVYGSPASALRHCALLALASLLFVLA